MYFSKLIAYVYNIYNLTHTHTKVFIQFII